MKFVFIFYCFLILSSDLLAYSDSVLINTLFESYLPKKDPIYYEMDYSIKDDTSNFVTKRGKVIYHYNINFLQIEEGNLKTLYFDTMVLKVNQKTKKMEIRKSKKSINDITMKSLLEIFKRLNVRLIKDKDSLDYAIYFLKFPNVDTSVCKMYYDKKKKLIHRYSYSYFVPLSLSEFALKHISIVYTNYKIVKASWSIFDFVSRKGEGYVVHQNYKDYELNVKL
jgi:hypothetical protein